MKNLSVFFTIFYIIVTIEQILFVQKCSALEDIDVITKLVTQEIKGKKLRKCDCKADELLIKDICTKSDIKTTIPVLYDLAIPEPVAVNTTEFDVLENAGLQCGPGHVPTSLKPYDFHIFHTGELIHLYTLQTFGPLYYCINHVESETLPFEWEIRICLEPPRLPICCQDDNPTCHNPNPAIWYGASLLSHPFIKDVQKEKFECNNASHVVVHSLLNSDRNNPVLLTYEEHEPILQVGGNTIPQFIFPDQYCITPTKSPDEYDVQYCQLDLLKEHHMICQNNTCVRKCCPEGQAFLMEQSENPFCAPVNESLWWLPSIQNTSNDLQLVYGMPLCQGKPLFITNSKDPNDRFLLLQNGNISFPKIDQTFPSSRYCLDNFIYDSEVVEGALRCFPEEKQLSKCEVIKNVLFPCLQAISCFFLLITLIVYVTIPELHSKLHGKSLISHVSALFFAYLVLSIQTIKQTNLVMSLCRAMAFLMQFSFLAAFFWLNVMCFDIWWTLRSMRPVAETSESFRRRFSLYSLYAWGCPLIISIVTFSLETLDQHLYPNLILPGIGITNCWFKDDLSTWFYFYSFVAILIAIDIFFFVCVAIILIQAQRANNNILRTTSKQHKERIWIYLKLFVVMGITWICELVSWREGSCSYWFFTDVVNSLQGFFIFLIFICKRNIFAKLRTRGTASTRKIRRMVQGSSSYGSSSQVSQQTSLDSSRKLSGNLHNHLSKLNKEHIIVEDPKKVQL